MRSTMAARKPPSINRHIPDVSGIGGGATDLIVRLVAQLGIDLERIVPVKAADSSRRTGVTVAEPQAYTFMTS